MKGLPHAELQRLYISESSVLSWERCLTGDMTVRIIIGFGNGVGDGDGDARRYRKGLEATWRIAAAARASAWRQPTAWGLEIPQKLFKAASLAALPVNASAGLSQAVQYSQMLHVMNHHGKSHTRVIMAKATYAASHTEFWLS